MKIVLTGYKGFIASHYYDYLKNNHEVYTYDLLDRQDLKDKAVTSSMPDCDIVVHMAATNGTRLFYEMPTEVSFNNTLPTFNLIERYKNTNTKFVFTSTCEIFNGAVDKGLYPVPTDENVPVMFNDIKNPRWSYSIPKALGENLIANCGLDWLVLRYFNVYGPKQENHFISEFVERVKNGEYYINGNDTRSFCYINDAITMTHQLVESANNQIINVGRQEEIQIEDVAKCILDIMGVDPSKLVINHAPEGSAKRRCPDTTLVQELTGFKNYTSLQEGLAKTIKELI